MFKVEWTRIVTIQSTINMLLGYSHQNRKDMANQKTISKTPNSSSSVSCMNHNAANPRAIALGKT